VDTHVDHDKKSAFHNVQREYPGLEVLHKSPDVLVVENFLTDDECNRIMAKAKPHLVPCLVKNAESGKVEVDPDRTSFNINIPKDEVPTIVSKLTALTNCDERQLEILQVLRYTEGQHFTPHTDGFSGPISAAGFQHSGRLVTIFVYLNDVLEGGQTRFPELGLDVAPRKGMAVLHFPTTLDLKQDYRTKHEGVAAVDEKWLLVTWVWKNFRTDQRYGELHDLPLDQNDII
jgi:prolyl 4-hydroxylase